MLTGRAVLFLRIAGLTATEACESPPKPDDGPVDASDANEVGDAGAAWRGRRRRKVRAAPAARHSPVRHPSHPRRLLPIW